MKTAFAAALALSLLSGTAMAAPSDTRGDQQQSHQDRGDNQTRGDRPSRGDHQGQNNQGQNNQGQAHQPQGNQQNQNTPPRGNQGQSNGQNNGQHNGQANNQPRPQQGGNWQGNNDRGGQRGNDRHYGNNDRGSSRNYEYNGRRHESVRGPAWRAPRGYDARRVWSRGDRLPYAYRDRAYVIDYRAYGLMRPSYGYQWVRVSNNVFLVNVSNGFISQIVFSMFY
ncbi:MAG: RcnB family protein [Parvibaculaceae bacterium]